jgi:hypothetical protein
LPARKEVVHQDRRNIGWDAARLAGKHADDLGGPSADSNAVTQIPLAVMLMAGVCPAIVDASKKGQRLYSICEFSKRSEKAKMAGRVRPAVA